MSLRLDALQNGRYAEDLSRFPSSRRNPLDGRPFSYRLADDGSAVLEIEFEANTLEDVNERFFLPADT